jgi:RimJ/RimL family protein N-acetyltransferase
MALHHTILLPQSQVSAMAVLQFPDAPAPPPGFVWVCPPQDEEKCQAYRRAILGHWEVLSKADLLSRFWHTPSPSLLSRRAELLDFSLVAVAGLAHGDRPDVLVGVGEVGPDVTATNRAEMAFSILPEWRGQRLAAHVLQRLLWVAKKRDYDEARAACLPDNLACKRLCESLGVTHEFIDDIQGGLLVFDWTL